MDLQELCKQITSLKCSKHGDSYGFLCIEKVCNHEERLMCAQCVDLHKTHEQINIQKAFELLGRQVTQQEAELKESKASLWQQFIKHKVQLLEQLNQLESVMKTFIDSSLGNETFVQLQKLLVNNGVNLRNSKQLGSVLSEVGGQGQYQFLQQLSLNQQHCYFLSIEILKEYEQTLNVVSDKLNNIVKTNYQNIEQQMETGLIIQEDVNINGQDYNVIQTIKLDNCCFWLCFNHNKTQIAAAVGQEIIFLNYSQGGQWIKGEQILIGHTQDILQVKFNHISTQIASCGKDNQIIIWNKQQNGQWSIQDKLTEHKKIVKSICYNHNSTIIASGSDDKSIKLYTQNNDKWHLKQQLIGHTEGVNDVCFNHDSTLLASRGNDQIIILWECNNVGQWIIKQKLIGHCLWVNRVTFNSKSTQLISGSSGNSMKIWEIDNENQWNCIHTLTRHMYMVRSAYFNQRSNMIVSSGQDKQILVWRLNEENNWKCTQTIKEDDSQFYCAIISNDSSMLISASSNNTILIYKQ